MPRSLNENGITDKEQLFCDFYLGESQLNAKDAAIKAGYSAHSIKVTAYVVLNRPRVQDYLNKMKSERLERMNVDKDYVLQRLLEIDTLDVADILDDDMEFKSVSSWPSVWRRSISAIDVINMGEGKVNKVRWPDKVKNLEMLGKHVEINAWTKEESDINVVNHIMPVPTADSVDDWEKASKDVHDKNLQDSD